MSTLSIRPDMRTSGGEVSDIVINGRYAGEITLVYREGSRLSGAVQLEKTVLSPSDKRKVLRYVQEYINSLAAAIDAADCEVIVTYSSFDQVIAMEHNVGEIESFVDETEDEWDDYEADYVDNDTNLSDYEPEQSADTYEMNGRVASRSSASGHSGRTSDTRQAREIGSMNQDKQVKEQDRQAAGSSDHDPGQRYGSDASELEPHELVITGEHGSSVEYHIYAKDRRWLAEAFVTLHGSDCIGEINWMIEPTPEQIEQAVELLISDFDDDLVDSFQLEVKHNGELLEVYELEHEDIADYEDATSSGQEVDDEYSVHLVRDDGDTLTYDIYSRKNGHLPIGTATIDISQRKLTGYMDFREMNDERDREQIASQLMRELDKEKDYDSFNLTVLYKNRPIDELLFENTPVQ